MVIADIFQIRVVIWSINDNLNSNNTILKTLLISRLTKLYYPLKAVSAMWLDNQLLAFYFGMIDNKRVCLGL